MMVEADTDRILEALAARPGFPTEAVRMAAANRVAVVPAMLERFEAFTTGSDRSELNADILFLSFHLLGEWREKSAFRPLARFLRCPDDAVEFALGDGNCETCHRVMAMLFDGDPQPLYDIILDPAADEFVRSRMCETVAMVAIRGELPREEATRFLRACYSELERQDPCYVWDGWQGAVAMLGLQDLVPQVKVVFERELVDPAWLSYDDFEDDLKRAIDNPDFPYARPKEYEDWTDTAAGLSHWSSFSEQQVSERTTDDILAARLRHTMQAFTPGLEPPMPLVNPYRNIGRNDPCPCGSGKKFKKCCLGKELA